MITLVTTAVLTVVIGGVVSAFALPLAKRIVTAWTRLYTAIASEDGQTRRAEVRSDLHEQIIACRDEGYSPHAIALQVWLRFVMGLPDDLAWCAPFVPATLADKTASCSETLKRFRTPKQLVPSLATFAIMNWAFYGSRSDGTLLEWFGLNAIGVAVVALLWNQHRRNARRILHAWLGMAAIVMMTLMVWLTVQHQLYTLAIFRVYAVALTALGLAMLVAERSFRTHLFRGRWRLVIISWVLIALVSLAASALLVGNITPLLIAWATIALLIVALVVLCGGFALGAAAAWHTGLQGSAAALRLVAAGIRHLR